MHRIARVSLAVLLVSATRAAFAQQLTPEAQRALAHYRVGWEMMRAEAWSGAARAFQAAVEVEPRFAPAYYGLGRAAMALKQFEDAVKAYVACRDLYRSRAGEHFNDQIQARRSREDQIAQLREAIRQASQGSQLLTQQRQQMIRSMQLQLQQLELAQRSNAAMTMDFSVPFYVSLALGSAYFRLDRFAEAERAYKEAIEAEPGSGETHNNLAVLFMVTGRYDDAENEVRLAEKYGFKVNRQFKEELKGKKAGRPRSTLGLERIQSRRIPAAQLERLARWLDTEPEVPDGLWYKRLSGMTVCGEGELTTSLVRWRRQKGPGD